MRILRRLAQSGSAFALGAKGRRFESYISDQNKVSCSPSTKNTLTETVKYGVI
jgi:hypothetical protein